MPIGSNYIELSTIDAEPNPLYEYYPMDITMKVANKYYNFHSLEIFSCGHHTDKLIPIFRDDDWLDYKHPFPQYEGVVKLCQFCHPEAYVNIKDFKLLTLEIREVKRI